MTRRRWIADEFSEHQAALAGEHAAHLARTLRAKVGQEFEIACGDQVRRATVSSVADDRVEFALGESLQSQAAIPITLLLAIFKFDRMEWAIEKCTELNVTNIVPVIARRTEKHLAAAADKRVERWRRIARQASEQSRRTSPPEIGDPAKLKDVLGYGARVALGASDGGEAELPPGASLPDQEPGTGETAFSPGREPGVRPAVKPSPVGTAQLPRDLRIVLAETEQEVTLAAALRSQPDLQSLALAIGPEGGWTEDELQSFAKSQWISASLGDTILRAETAAIAALAIARASL